MKRRGFLAGLAGLFPASAGLRRANARPVEPVEALPLSAGARSLPPATPGQSYCRLFQCLYADGSTPTAANPSGFLPTDSLQAMVAQDGVASAIFPEVEWFNAGLAQVGVTITDRLSAMLRPDKSYRLTVWVQRWGHAYKILDAALPVANSE